MADSSVTRNMKAVLKAVAVAVNVFVAGATVFSAYGGMINPDATSLGALAAMIFPIMIVITIVFMVFMLLWSWKASLANALVIVVCWGPVMTFCPLNFSRPDPKQVEAEGGKVLKVVTFNTLCLNDFSPRDSVKENRTLRFMIDTDADILLCQELPSEISAGPRYITSGQVSELNAVYPYKAVDERGMGVLSKYPFEIVPLHYSDRYKYDVCRYDMVIGSDTVHLFNLHLQSIGLTPSDKQLYRNITEGDSPNDLDEIKHGLIGKLTAAFCERAKQARVVRDAVDEVSGTVLLAGDFNDIPGCYASRIIAGDDLADVYRCAGFGPQISYHADRFYFRIDQMYCRGALRPLRAECGGTDASDHYPLIAWFELDR